MNWLPKFLLSLTLSMAYTISMARGQLHQSMAPILEKITPAVVNISVMGNLPLAAQQPPKKDNKPQTFPDFTGPQLFRAVGTGVIIDHSKGYIITNAHVVDKADSINIVLNDGRKVKAKKIGLDQASDIAVLQIDAQSLTQIPIGDSNKVHVGDFVTAIGNPFGLHQSVTSGMISALHRDDLHIEGYEDFIQTDAPINPGNSGGALVNQSGELIGINTAIFAGSEHIGNIGIGFAIPIDMAMNVANQLIKHGKVDRGLLGVMIQKITPSLASAMHLPSVHGALITEITHDSPAEKAGLQAKDFIETVNGTPLTTSNQLRNITGMLPIGTCVEITGQRNGKKFNKKLSIISLKTLNESINKHVTLMHGVQLRAVEGLNVMGDTIQGVGVDIVNPRSLAWMGGLRPGDIILEANDRTVQHIEELKKIIKSNTHQMLLKVYRSNGMYFLALEG